MSISNLKEHNKSKLEIIDEKINAVETVVEKNARILENKKTNFIEDKITGLTSELENLNLTYEVTNDKIINYLDLENFLKYDNFETKQEKRIGFGFFKYILIFIISLLTGLGIYIEKAISLKIVDLSNISRTIDILFSKETSSSVFGSLSGLIPGIEGQYILGVSISLMFIILSIIYYNMNKFKRNKYEKNISKELEEYEKYTEEKKDDYLEVNNEIEELLALFEIYGVILTEETSKLKRINFLRNDEDQLSVANIKSVGKIKSLLDHIKTMMDINLLKDNMLNPELVFATKEGRKFLTDYIKKMDKE